MCCRSDTFWSLVIVVTKLTAVAIAAAIAGIIFVIVSLCRTVARMARRAVP